MLNLLRVVSKTNEDYDVRKYKDYNYLIISKKASNEDIKYTLGFQGDYGFTPIADLDIYDRKISKEFKLFPDYIKGARITGKNDFYNAFLLANRDKKLYFYDRHNEDAYNWTEDMKINDIDLSQYSPSNRFCLELEFLEEKLKPLLHNQHTVYIKVVFISKDEDIYNKIDTQRKFELNKKGMNEPKNLFYQKDNFGTSSWITLSTSRFVDIYYDLIGNNRCYYILDYNIRGQRHAVVLTIELMSEKKVLFELVDSNGGSRLLHINIWFRQLIIFFISQGYDTSFNYTIYEPYLPQTLIFLSKNLTSEMSKEDISMIPDEGESSVLSFYYIWLRIHNPNLSGKLIRRYIASINLDVLSKRTQKISSYLLGNREEDEIL